MEHMFFSFPMLFTFIIFLFMLLKIWKRFKTNNLILNLPPGPWKLPVIGNLHILAAAGSPPHQSLRDLAKKYGPLMHIQLGEVLNIVVSCPKTAAEVMKTHDLVFVNRPLLLSAKILTCNAIDIAFAPNGDCRRQLRKISVLELLSSKRVRSFGPIREEEVSKFVRVIASKAGSSVNLTKMLCSLSYEIVIKTAFGGKCKEIEEFTTLLKAGSKLISGFAVSDLFPSVMLTGLRPKLERLHQKLDKILDNVINEHKASKKMPHSEGKSDDLLDVLLNHQGNGDLDFPLTTDNIKAVILDVFDAGSDTSFTTLEWAISELLKSPRVMQKAQAEVRRVFQRKGNVDVEGLQELEYLKLVVKETLRLHPPLPLVLPRECSEKCKINGYDITGKVQSYR